MLDVDDPAQEGRLDASYQKAPEAEGVAYQVNWFNMAGLIWRTILCHAGVFMFFTVLKACAAAEANLAVIVSIFASAAFFTAFVFQCVFNE